VYVCLCTERGRGGYPQPHATLSLCASPVAGIYIYMCVYIKYMCVCVCDIDLDLDMCFCTERGGGGGERVDPNPPPPFRGVSVQRLVCISIYVNLCIYVRYLG